MLPEDSEPDPRPFSSPYNPPDVCPKRREIEREAHRCADVVFSELTGGAPRPEFWYRWFLCERHGGAPLIDNAMTAGQIAYWDGEDIVIDGRAAIELIAAALPEELTHRLSSPESPRFEGLNFTLRYAHRVGKIEFQELVGQRVADLFAARIAVSSSAPQIENHVGIRSD